mgnify:CR=1 FL=1
MSFHLLFSSLLSPLSHPPPTTTPPPTTPTTTTTHRQQVRVHPLGVDRVRVQDQEIGPALVGGVADSDARVVARLRVERLLQEPDGGRVRARGLQGSGDGLEPGRVGLRGGGDLVDEQHRDRGAVVGPGERAGRGQRRSGGGGSGGRRGRGRGGGVCFPSACGADEGDEEGVVLEDGLWKCLVEGWLLVVGGGGGGGGWG